MPIPSSTAPAVRDWLFAQCTATLTPDPDDKSISLLVCYDEPGPYQPEDIVSIGGVLREIGTNSLVGGGGAGWLEEKYRITIAVEVYRGGDSAQIAFNRASFLIDQVIAIFRGSVDAGGLVLICKPISSSCDVAWDEEHKGRLAYGEVVIECYQRI